MNGRELDISFSFIQLALSTSSNHKWKPHIHSIAKHAPKKLGFLSRARGYFSPPQQLTIYKSQIWPSIVYCSFVWGGAPKSSLHLLDKVKSKGIRLINNPALTNSLQSLSHRCLLQIFPFSTDIFMDTALWKSRILFLIQWGVFGQPEPLPNRTLSKSHYLIYEL